MVDLKKPDLEFIVYNPFRDEKSDINTFLSTEFLLDSIDSRFFIPGDMFATNEDDARKINEQKVKNGTIVLEANQSALISSFDFEGNKYGLKYGPGKEVLLRSINFFEFMKWVSTRSRDEINPEDALKYAQLMSDFRDGNVTKWLLGNVLPEDKQKGLSAQRLLKLDDLSKYGKVVLSQHPNFVALGCYTSKLADFLGLDNIPLVSHARLFPDNYLKQDVSFVMDTSLFNKIGRNKHFISTSTSTPTKKEENKPEDHFRVALKRTSTDFWQRYGHHTFYVCSSSPDYLQRARAVIAKNYVISNPDNQILSSTSRDELLRTFPDHENMINVFLVDMSLPNGEGRDIVERARDRCGKNQAIIATTKNFEADCYYSFRKGVVDLIDQSKDDWETSLSDALKRSLFKPLKPDQPKVCICLGDSGAGKTSECIYIVDLFPYIDLKRKYVSRPNRPQVKWLPPDDSIFTENYQSKEEQEFPVLHAQRNGHHLWIDTAEIVDTIVRTKNSAIFSATPPSIAKDFISLVREKKIPYIDPSQIHVYLIEPPLNVLRQRQDNVISLYDGLINGTTEQQAKAAYTILQKEIKDRRAQPITYGGLKKFCNENGVKFKRFSGNEAKNPFVMASRIRTDIYGPRYNDSLNNIYSD